MIEILIEILNNLKLAYWVEIVTEDPKCTYYFGPFLNKKQANNAHQGYLEDLKNEGAQSIRVKIKRFKPNQLTIDDEDSGTKKPTLPSTFSSQIF